MRPTDGTTDHPLYGRLPLLRRSAKDARGREIVRWEYDPQFEPRLPKGAIRGTPAKQVYCTAHHVPKYFYVDQPRRCVQCGAAFTFRAEEQRYWYEVLKFNFGSVAIRCVECRRRARSRAALGNQIAEARAALRADPEDPAKLLGLAEAVVRYHQRIGEGRLDDAIAASRAARRLWPDTPATWFWEGVAHHLAGRLSRARPSLERFLASPGLHRRPLKAMADEARTLLDATGAA